MHPCTQIREVTVVLMTPRVELSLGSMIAVGGPHRSDNGQLVDLLRHMREPVADLDATLAMLLKFHLQWVKQVPLIAISIRNHQSLKRQFLRILSVGKGSFSDGLPSVFGQHRLWVEALHVTDTTIHKQPNHTLRFGWEMRLAVGRYPVSITAIAISLQHGRKGQARRTHAKVGEESATVIHVHDFL